MRRFDWRYVVWLLTVLLFFGWVVGMGVLGGTNPTLAQRVHQARWPFIAVVITLATLTAVHFIGEFRSRAEQPDIPASLRTRFTVIFIIVIVLVLASQAVIEISPEARRQTLERAGLWLGFAAFFGIAAIALGVGILLAKSVAARQACVAPGRLFLVMAACSAGFGILRIAAVPKGLDLLLLLAGMFAISAAVKRFGKDLEDHRRQFGEDWWRTKER